MRLQFTFYNCPPNSEFTEIKYQKPISAVNYCGVIKDQQRTLCLYILTIINTGAMKPFLDWSCSVSVVCEMKISSTRDKCIYQDKLIMLATEIMELRLGCIRIVASTFGKRLGCQTRLHGDAATLAAMGTYCSLTGVAEAPKVPNSIAGRGHKKLRSTLVWTPRKDASLHCCHILPKLDH